MVEFGDKTVREVMTPRPEIVAVPVTTTVEELTDLVEEISLLAHSGVRRDIDHIKGIVFAKDLLQVADVEARSTTVSDLMRPECTLFPRPS